MIGHRAFRSRSYVLLAPHTILTHQFPSGLAGNGKRTSGTWT